VFADNNLASFLPIAVILFVLSGRVEFHARLYRFIASVLVMFLTYGAMIDQQTLAPVFTIAAGMFLTVAGIQYREKMPFLSGNICVAGGFLFYWEYAVNIYATAPWISSIILGLLVILLASYIENKDKMIMAKTRYYFNQLKNWN
jgi:LytS/YehU family sensor histidine kinase